MNPSGRFRAVLLDLDGTLIDSVELILSSYRHTMREHLGRRLPDQEWLETMGQPLLAQLRDFARDEAEARAMLETYSRHNRRVHDDLVRPFEGVRDYIASLHEAGHVLGIVTSKRRESALRGLEACGFELGWFRTVVTASDLEAHKPDPAPVHRALDEAGVEEPGRAVFVGDSVHDMHAGRAAGTRTAAALWGPYGRDVLAEAEPDYWLERIEGLDRVLADGEETTPGAARG